MSKYPDTNQGPSMHILVTGGAGFVGSNLVDVLMQQGHKVTVMDNLHTGRLQNIEHWMGHPHFTFLKEDIVDNPTHVECDQIFHLACPASPPHYMEDRIHTIMTSTHGTMNILNMAKKNGARILFTSTSEVYGDPEVHPQPESYWGNVNPIGIRACYDEGKRVAETMCYAFMEKGLEVRVARIFNTFGPRMHPEDGRVVSNFIIQALKGIPLTVYGDGSQTRSFQYVADLVRGLLKLMASDYTKPCNIGTPNEYSIIDFAKLIQGFVAPDNPPAITFQELGADDPKCRRPDGTVAKKEIGWEPEVTLNDGLRWTVENFKQELGIRRDENDKVQLWLDAAAKSCRK